MPPIHGEAGMDFGMLVERERDSKGAGRYPPVSIPPLPTTPELPGECAIPLDIRALHSAEQRPEARQGTPGPAYDVTSPRPSRSAYDVTSPRLSRPSRMASSHTKVPLQTPQVPQVDFGAQAIPLDIPPISEIKHHLRGDSGTGQAEGLLPAMTLSPSIPFQPKFSAPAHARTDHPASPLVPPTTPTVSTPTPPRPARRRYDARRPLSNSSISIGTPSAPQPSPLTLPSPAPSRLRIPTGLQPPPSTPMPSSADREGKACTPEDRREGGRSEKRDSTQRRMDALKGLVASIDFGQPWSIPDFGAPGPEEEPADRSSENADTWEADRPAPRTQGLVAQMVDYGRDFEEGPVRPQDPDHVDRTGLDFGSPARVAPMLDKPVKRERPKVGSKVRMRTTSPGRPLGAVSQDHGWPSPSTTPVRAVRDTPPRPRQRTEVFNVASAGYNSSAPVTPVPRVPMDSGTPLSTQYTHGAAGRSDLTPSAGPATWRSTLSSDTIYTRLLSLSDGPARVTRQEVMWEMCETEQVFLRSIRTVLRLFATPVKTPQGRWIDGIPPAISELFDNLESIAHVHGVLCASQRDMQRRAEVLDFDTFVAVLKGWTPRLEGAYEWYLCKFEAVVALVEEHVRDGESVFGEFVRMQLQDDALGSMSLGSMLLKPVQRLMKYPLFLKASLVLCE